MIVLILNSNEGKVWKTGVLETGKAMKHGFKKIKKKKNSTFIFAAMAVSWVNTVLRQFF